jgi:hypothetical protein
VIETGAEGRNAVQQHIDREAAQIRAGLSIITGMPLIPPPADPAADMTAVSDALDTMTPEQHRRVLAFITGYDTDSVAKAIRRVRGQDGTQK